MRAIWHANTNDPVVPAIMYVVQEGYLKMAVMPIKKKEWLQAILLSCKHPCTINSSKHIRKHLGSDTRFRGCANIAFDLLPTVGARWSSALSVLCLILQLFVRLNLSRLGLTNWWYQPFPTNGCPSLYWLCFFPRNYFLLQFLIINHR